MSLTDDGGPSRPNIETSDAMECTLGGEGCSAGDAMSWIEDCRPSRPDIEPFVFAPQSLYCACYFILVEFVVILSVWTSLL